MLDYGWRLAPTATNCSDLDVLIVICHFELEHNAPSCEKTITLWQVFNVSSRFQVPGLLSSLFHHSSCARSKRFRWLHIRHDRRAGQKGSGLFPLHRVAL